MASQHENKSATSPPSTPLPSPTSTFVSSHTTADGPLSDTAEHSQSIPSGAPFQQVLQSSPETMISVRARGTHPLQTSSSAELAESTTKSPSSLRRPKAPSVAKEDQGPPARSQVALDRPPHQDTQASPTRRSTTVSPGKHILPHDAGDSLPETYPAVTPNTKSLPQETRAPSDSGSPSVVSNTKPDPRASSVLRSQSLRSLHSVSSLRVPTRLSSLRSDTSVSPDSFNTDLRPQASVPAFLGRHRTSPNTKGVQRTVSLGSIAELHSTAQQSYRNRTFSLPIAKQRRLSSPAVRRRFESDSDLIARRNASITSVEELKELLSTNEEVLFVDIAQKPDLDILFPARRLPIPLIYRQSSPAAPTTASKQAVFVPLFVNKQLRPRSTSSMRPSADYWPRDEEGFPQPSGHSESMEDLLGREEEEEEEEEEEQERAVVAVGPAQGAPQPRGLRRWLRKVKDLARRALGMRRE